MSCTTFKECVQDKDFPFIASVALAGCVLIFFALVIWLIIRMRKLQGELEQIRNDMAYSNPGPATKIRKPIADQNEYAPNIKVETPPETKRQSAQHPDLDEIVIYVPSPKLSPRITDKSHARVLISGATSDQSNASVNDPCREVLQIEMQELYENQESIQLSQDSRETSTDPVTDARDLHEFSRQLSRDEHAFGNEGFEDDVITEPIYQNRGDLAGFNNPELEFVTDSDDWKASNTGF